MVTASLAVRYRPRRFADVAGQRHVCAVLRDAARRHQPPQQILLSGESGLGKTTLARIFAAALFCTDPGEAGDACGVCEECRDVAGGRHPDVVEFDAASNGGKDEIRSIAERVALTPMRAAWKVYVIDEAHGLSGPGTQAALKMIEEPPAHAVFILATTEPGKLGTALRGRCTWLEVLRPTDEEIAANLSRIAYAENWELPEDLIDAILAATDPALGMRGTVMTLEKLAGPLGEHRDLGLDELEDLLGTVAPERLATLTAAITAQDKAAALSALARLMSRSGTGQLRAQLLGWARREMLQACRDRDGVEQAYYRFETLAQAGVYPGALEVAVARMASPALGDSPQALRALLEQAAALTASRGAVAPLPAAPTAPTAPAGEPGAPARAADAPAGKTTTPAAPPAAPPAAVPAAPATAAAPATPAGSGGVPLPAGDPALVQLLNVIGTRQARAAAVLRRCPVLRYPDGALVVVIPDAVRSRADAENLPALLAAAAADGSVPNLAAVPR